MSLVPRLKELHEGLILGRMMSGGLASDFIKITRVADHGYWFTHSGITNGFCKTGEYPNNGEWNVVIGHPITLSHLVEIIKDKHYLIDNWKGDLLEDQDEALIDWINNNLLTPNSICDKMET